MKLKAYFLRWLHLVCHTLNYVGSFVDVETSGLRPNVHLAYNVQTVIYIFKIPVWRRTDVIACTCGKRFYERKEKK